MTWTRMALAGGEQAIFFAAKSTQLGVWLREAKR